MANVMKLSLTQCMHVVFSGGPGIYSRKTDDNLISWMNINSFLKTKKGPGVGYWAPCWGPLLLWYRAVSPGGDPTITTLDSPDDAPVHQQLLDVLWVGQKATPVGKQLLLFSLTPTRAALLPELTWHVLFGRLTREVRRWVDVNYGDDCHGNDGSSVQWHLSCCGGFSPADWCASKGWAAPRCAKHQMASPRAELLAQCHPSVDSFGAGLASSLLHAGAKAQAQWFLSVPAKMTQV